MKLTKLYYSIGEVSSMFDVNSSLIRFWEKEFKVIKPTKNKKGNRLFTPKDIENFERIYQLVKVEGYTLDGAKQQLKQSKKNKKSTSHLEVIEKLEQMKKQLNQLKTTL